MLHASLCVPQQTRATKDFTLQCRVCHREGLERGQRVRLDLFVLRGATALPGRCTVGPDGIQTFSHLAEPSMPPPGSNARGLSCVSLFGNKGAMRPRGSAACIT